MEGAEKFLSQSGTPLCTEAGISGLFFWYLGSIVAIRVLISSDNKLCLQACFDIISIAYKLSTLNSRMEAAKFPNWQKTIF